MCVHFLELEITLAAIIVIVIYIKGNIDLKKNGCFERTGEKPPFGLQLY